MQFLSRMMVVLVNAMIFVGCAHMDDNFRAVEDDVFYRSAQMRGGRLGEAIRDHKIATVVNLRGESDEPWHAEEKAVCEAFGVRHIDYRWSMRKLPDPESLASYVALVEHAEGPVLVHCQGGIHRAGTASAIYVLMQGGTPDEARQQFGFYFHNAPIGQLVTLYEEHGKGKRFADWVRSDYPELYDDWMAANEKKG